tara:strand:+ start:41801 stop:45577 length:3777 start_codon:yes stop_codon:yes gene_type:complete
MESFGLLRTNSNLTSNVKVIVSSDDLLYFESFDSSATLGDNRYKKKIIPEGLLYNKELSKFWKGTPVDLIFESKNLDDFDIMYSTYDNQIDDIYLSGSANVKDTDYTEDYEYLAPLHVYPGNLPKDFIVFRVDGAGIMDLTKEKFREEILNNMKVVNRYDLTPKTKLGNFLELSFNQETLPTSSIDLNFNIGEFTYWKGVDYITGEYINKGTIMNDEFKKEMTFTQGSDILTSGFKERGLIYPYIINLKFLYNDRPATPDNLRKWSINRYYGFYGNLEEIDNITPYKPTQLKSTMKLSSNKIFTLNGENVDPFERGHKTDRTYYVEYLSKFYLISKMEDGSFKIISDIDLPLDVDTHYNLNTITFGTNNEISYISGSPFIIDSTADMIIIEVNGMFHRLINDGTDWKILSDYRFTVTNNIFKYYINKTDLNDTTVINLNDVDINNPPLNFKIYQYNFNDIKDFDLDILDTDFSKFEFEFEEDITNTEEPKLYENDMTFANNDVIQTYLYKNNVVSIPTSEYLSTHELYEISENGTRPNKMWAKNSKVVKWGVDGSISNNDYPYMFNINHKADNYNRTTDTSELIPDRQSRNMDYFYTLSDSSYNFGYTSSVQYQSLSVINDDSFEIDKYFNYGTYSTNYFDEIFGQNETYNSLVNPIRKYSELLKGDQVKPNKTLFKGLNISLYDIDSVLTNVENDTKSISSLNVKGTNDFENYKFSIILSDLSNDIDADFSENTIDSDWNIIKKWERNTSYSTGDIVLFDGSSFKDSNGNYGFNGYATESGTGSIVSNAYIYPNGISETLFVDGVTNLATVVSASGPNNGISQLFKCTSDTVVVDPTLNLMDDPNWDIYPNGYKSIFYTPDVNYTAWDSISAPYSYLVDPNSGIDYNYLDYFMYYNGEYYKCTKDQSIKEGKTPNYKGISIINGQQVEYWEKINEYLTTVNYTEDEIVTLNGDLVYYTFSNQNLDIIHSFKSFAKTPYKLYDTIKFNDNLYIANKKDSILDNGINIYINKKWDNILVQIYFNDGISPTFNIKRDNLYCAELQQIVASNFIEMVNEITLFNGFINPLNYYVIESDDSYTKYEISNIENIPHILQIESPVEIKFYSHSLNLSEVDINPNILKINKMLENNELISVDQVDYYNNTNVAYRYERLDGFGFRDKTDILYRFNGLYSPIFNNINIFNNVNYKKYNFNENFENFGEIREIIKSKVGDSNLLKITDDSYKSIFPQVDEIGYFIDTHNIFKSTWDTKYYKKTIVNN